MFVCSILFLHIFIYIENKLEKKLKNDKKDVINFFFKSNLYVIMATLFKNVTLTL